jgi:predicted phage baseplate assembly protein
VAAVGGRDQETLEEAKLRARREMRAQQRAVTAEDYEVLALGASRSIARVKCNAPGNGQGNGHGSLPAGMIELLVVPAVAEALLGDNLGALHLDNLLREVVVSYLDQYRLLTTTLSVREPRYRGIKVSAEIVCSEYSRPEIVRLRVAETLRAFLSPLPLPGLSDQVRAMLPDDWKGWPFGKPLYLSEIYSLIQQVPGVKHVVEVKLSEREVTPSKERLPGEITSGNPPVEPKLIEARRIAIPADTLFCSLDHEIQDVSL